MYLAAPSRSAKRLIRFMFILFRSLRHSFRSVFGIVIFWRIGRAGVLTRRFVGESCPNACFQVNGRPTARFRVNGFRHFHQNTALAAEPVGDFAPGRKQFGHRMFGGAVLADQMERNNIYGSSLGLTKSPVLPVDVTSLFKGEEQRDER